MGVQYGWYYLQYGSGRSHVVGRMAVEIVIVVAVVAVAGGGRSTEW